MTDAEIRGDIDGLILSKIVRANSNLRLSQVLDMYYNKRGIDINYRACNRKNLISEVTSQQELQYEVSVHLPVQIC